MSWIWNLDKPVLKYKGKFYRKGEILPEDIDGKIIKANKKFIVKNKPKSKIVPKKEIKNDEITKKD